MHKTISALFLGLFIVSASSQSMAHDAGMWAGASNAPAARSEVSVAVGGRVNGSPHQGGDRSNIVEVFTPKQ